MKKCLFIMVFLLLLLPNVVKAAEMTTSVPSGSQYAPGRSYRFQIKCDEVNNISSVNFEWNGASNPANSTSNNDTFSYILSDLATGSYTYKWYVSNSTYTANFSDTYDVLQNSSVPIILTINGKQGNVSLTKYKMVNFVASLNLPNRIIKLESNYPNFTTLTNTSYISYSTNLTDANIYMITASWDGDQNYTSSSKTYYFDGGPPQITNVFSMPSNVVGYIPNTEYKFQANIMDANLVDAWFESDFTGTMTSYHYTSNGSVQNSSGVFWITFYGLGVGNYSYRWHAKDDVSESYTAFINFQILKMNPLIMDIIPSTNVVEGTQVTATCYSVNPLQINVSNFNFYKNSESIGNISSSTRMGLFLLSSGTYNFTCNTSGTANYTNQSITKTVTVTSAAPKPQNITGELEISYVNFPSVETGNSSQAIFYLDNTMQKNIFNITVELMGISPDWYSIVTAPSSILSSETKEVIIDFNIPSDAEAKTYTITINIGGKTSDGKTASATKSIGMEITSPPVYLPPSYATPSSNITNGGEIVFSLGWFADAGMSGYIFSSNMSGEWVNDSWMPLTGTSGSFEIEKDLNSTSGIVAWKIYSNDTSNQWSPSDEYTFNTKSNPTNYMNLFFIVILVVIALLFAIIFLSRRKKPKEKTEYVYSKEDDNKNLYAL